MNGTISTTLSARDCSGFSVFSSGELGNMHVYAHDAFDRGEIRLGHDVLGRWLDASTGEGSDWVHLQFHMAVFELALGRWHAAYERFLVEILPVACASRLALTDAPSLLWRLTLAAPTGIDLPWAQLRCTADAVIDDVSDPFVELHQLLVLAGNGDAAAIEQRLERRAARYAPAQESLLAMAAHALAAIARRNYAVAARILRSLAPRMRLIGGSFAQNDLFRQLEAWCTRRNDGVDAPSGLILFAA